MKLLLHRGRRLKSACKQKFCNGGKNCPPPSPKQILSSGNMQRMYTIYTCTKDLNSIYKTIIFLGTCLPSLNISWIMCTYRPWQWIHLSPDVKNWRFNPQLLLCFSESRVYKVSVCFISNTTWEAVEIINTCIANT